MKGENEDELVRERGGEIVDSCELSFRLFSELQNTVKRLNAEDVCTIKSAGIKGGHHSLPGGHLRSIQGKEELMHSAFYLLTNVLLSNLDRCNTTLNPIFCFLDPFSF